MNDRQSRALRSYTRILGHLDDRATTLDPEATAVVARLKKTVVAITEYSRKQYLARISGHVGVARRELEQMRRDQMLPLARLARPIFVGERTIEAALRVPHTRAPIDVLLTASSLMVKTLRPHRKLLAASNIDPSRINRLQLETRRLKKVFAAAYVSAADRALPTRRLPPLFASARADVLTLDALMAASRGTSGDAGWRISRRVGKRMGRPRKSRPLRLVKTQVA